MDARMSPKVSSCEAVVRWITTLKSCGIPSEMFLPLKHLACPCWTSIIGSINTIPTTPSAVHPSTVARMLIRIRNLNWTKSLQWHCPSYSSRRRMPWKTRRFPMCCRIPSGTPTSGCTGRPCSLSSVGQARWR